MLQLTPGQHIHFIGIGGAGLSAIARILLERGFKISGSDLQSSALTAALAADGAQIYRGHDPAHLQGAQLVLASSAVAPQHPEIRAAQAQGIPVCKRRDILAALLQGHHSIAVAGTHGKTTTTAMIVHILQQADRDPSFIVGGTMGSSGKNAAVGSGSAFVIEADEYDNMFHGLRPDAAVITNIEHDHPDFFKSPQQLQAAFRTFAALLPAQGLLVACADDRAAAQLLRERRARGLPALSYGIASRQADWRATQLHDDGERTAFTVQRGAQRLGEVRLRVPGAHNVLNALAALAIAAAQDLPFAPAAEALGSFRSTARRFELRGSRDDVILVDDYAHHPTAIRANLRAARLRYPQRQIWAVWQPHTYSRVQQFMPAFLRAFDQADHVVITPIYPAREAPIAGISSRRLAATMPAHYAASLADAVRILRQQVRPPALVLIFSAGDADQIAGDYLQPEARRDARA